MNSLTRPLCIAAALMVGFAAAPAHADDYPNRPVRVVIPYPPGGGADSAARLLANHLTKAMGQSFIIDSRPGGNSVIAAIAAAKSTPDGYTLLMAGGTTMTLIPQTLEKPQYDPVNDFVPISMLSRFPFALVASSKLGLNSLKEVVDKARAEPGQLTYASNGTGGSVHLGMEVLDNMAKIKMVHVPYKGFAAALPDVISGRVGLMLADLAPIDAQVKAGSIKVLGVTSAERSPFFPGVPTIAEQGYPGYDFNIWFALYAPAKTPPEIVDKLNKEMRSWLATQEAKDQFNGIGHEPLGSSGDDIRKLIAEETKSFAPIVKSAGLKAE